MCVSGVLVCIGHEVEACSPPPLPLFHQEMANWHPADKAVGGGGGGGKHKRPQGLIKDASSTDFYFGANSISCYRKQAVQLPL